MPNAVTAAGKRTLKSNHSRLVGKDACMKVWIYERDEREICAMFAYCVGNSDTIIGFSVQKSVMSFFPQGGLTQPMAGCDPRRSRSTAAVRSHAARRQHRGDP